MTESVGERFLPLHSVFFAIHDYLTIVFHTDSAIPIHVENVKRFISILIFFNSLHQSERNA